MEIEIVPMHESPMTYDLVQCELDHLDESFPGLAFQRNERNTIPVGDISVIDELEHYEEDLDQWQIELVDRAHELSNLEYSDNYEIELAELADNLAGLIDDKPECPVTEIVFNPYVDTHGYATIYHDSAHTYTYEQVIGYAEHVNQLLRYEGSIVMVDDELYSLYVGMTNEAELAELIVKELGSNGF